MTINLSERISAACFQYVHGNNLVYNTSWEDPRLDRTALELTPDDSILVITSAGCNTLDYALQSPKHVYAVDVNPRQNALLELKLAGTRTLRYDEFFAMWGQGRLPGIEHTYRTRLRNQLTPFAQQYWDKNIGYFSGEGRYRGSFYFYGTTGLFAHAVNTYIDHVAGVRESINAILGASCLEEQREIYESSLYDAIWSRFVRWCVSRDTTLSLLGVPRPQRQEVEKHYGGIANFIESCLETVFTQLPLADNYFWRVYLTGQYTETCCPEYLKRENFDALRDGLSDRISIHTNTITGFLTEARRPITRLVLLDHMDWLSTHQMHALEQEWQAIVENANPGARILWRSGGMKTSFVDSIHVRTNGKIRRVGDLLRYNKSLAHELHAQDRVHTYGSFYIADLATA